MRDIFHREWAITARSPFLCLLILATVALGSQAVVQRARTFDQPGLPGLQAVLADVPTTDTRQRVLGYERDEFGHGWGPAPIPGPDAGCSTRDAALHAQSTGYEAASCRATAGVLFDPYTHTQVPLGSADHPLEVDHVIPLSAAWDLGAHAWEPEKRTRFANDPINLVVTSREANQDKSDSLPAEWLPPHPGSRCWYSRRLALVARTYKLPLPHADIATMRRQCGVWPRP